jgi:hypothetical protein
MNTERAPSSDARIFSNGLGLESIMANPPWSP